MPVTLICKPGEQVEWEVFKRYPKHSIALDGYCKGPPRSTDDGLILNINHHEDVDAIATCSSAEQSVRHINLGLYDYYCVDGEPDATLYANDPDEDVDWSTHALMHHEMVTRPKYERSIQLQDHLDISTGLYRVAPGDMGLLRELGWCTEPYRDARMAGHLRGMDAATMYDLILQTHRRINLHLQGRGKKVVLDMSYERMLDYPGWVMVRETGPHARYGMSHDGVVAFITYMGEHDGRHAYSLGRLSNAIPFPIPKILADLTAAEPALPDGTRPAWGGASNRGGADRKHGSAFEPQEVAQIVNERLHRTREYWEGLRNHATHHPGR